MRVRSWVIVLFLIVFISFFGCRGNKSAEEVKYLIGVAAADMREPWHLVLIDEMKKEAENHAEIRLIYTDAASDAEKQMEDIRKLVEYGIDLLIVSPCDAAKLMKPISDVYKVLPVIILDKLIDGFDYTLFIGPDNLKIGTLAGSAVQKLLYETGVVDRKNNKVLEIAGGADSAVAKKRHEGFMHMLPSDITVDTVFVESESRDVVEDLLLERPYLLESTAVIFAHNDNMALGAWKAVNGLGYSGIKIAGIDGFRNTEGALELLKKGVLDVDITCPTGGKDAVRRALDILKKQSGIPKQIILRSYTIDLSNVDDYESKRYRPPVITDRPIRVAHAQIGAEGGWRKANKISIEEAAKQFNIRLSALEAGSTQDSQIEIVKKFINSKVDIILLSPMVETGWDKILDECKAAHIPVILSDRRIIGADENLYLCFIGADFQEEGRRAMKWIADNVHRSANIGEPIKILEIRGTEGATPTIERKKGFEEVLAESSGYMIVHSLAGNYTYNGSYEAVMKYFTSTDAAKIDVIFCHNDDMALAAADALEKLGFQSGKDIKLVSVDGVKSALDAVQAGRINCVVECNPLFGTQLMKTVGDYFKGEEMPLRIITDEIVFTENTDKALFKNRKY